MFDREKGLRMRIRTVFAIGAAGLVVLAAPAGGAFANSVPGVAVPVQDDDGDELVSGAIVPAQDDDDDDLVASGIILAQDDDDDDFVASGIIPAQGGDLVRGALVSVRQGDDDGAEDAIGAGNAPARNDAPIDGRSRNDNTRDHRGPTEPEPQTDSSGLGTQRNDSTNETDQRSGPVAPQPRSVH
ncbi:hypothetical protein ACFYTQ_23515 [Nocardia sp. NPDC004068]|uniref:hypothetical protein n=1 Tax=Nocardia sp. NPDC004068 TaxID=3364303 RepID=UPI0036786D4A